MPPKKPLSRKRVAEADEYDSDNGFVEDAPKSKRSKTASSAGNELKQRDGKATVAVGKQVDDEGNEYWEISKMRRVQLSDFKGKTLVNIREFYEKDGKALPGRKGISLSVDQFAALLDILPELEAALKSKGEIVPRPQYERNAADAQPSPGAIDNEEGEEEAEGEEEEEKPDEEEDDHDIKTSSSKLDKFKYSKKNHEATSDEDD